GVWAKGILSDEYGVPANSVTYHVGGLDRDALWDWAPFRPPPDVQAHQLGPDQTLNGMLEAGEIDALYSAIEPPAPIGGPPGAAPRPECGGCSRITRASSGTTFDGRAFTRSCTRW